jgi:glutathione S-transferase
MTMLRLISATPSPYARKVRIALAEKNVPFELITEVPWDSTTVTPQYNPLEKLPVLLLENGDSVYESRFILEWIEVKFPTPALLPADPDARLFARKVEVVVDGVCDALVALFWERHRNADKQSDPWLQRQLRKVDGGMRALTGWAGDREFVVGDRFGLADIATGTVCRYLDVRFPAYPWRERHPNLARFSDRMERRPSFAWTVPVPQSISDKVV